MICRWAGNARIPASYSPHTAALRFFVYLQVNTGVSYLLDYVEDIYDDGGPRCPCFNIMYLPLPLGIPYLNQNATALKAEVWVETVTEGGRRFMAAWSKGDVDAGRHRHHSRRREKQRDWETCYRREFREATPIDLVDEPKVLSLYGRETDRDLRSACGCVA